MSISRLSSVLAVSAALCFSAGCSKKGSASRGASATAQQYAPASGSSQPMSKLTPHSSCPMDVPGTQVQVQDSSDGVSLILSNPDSSRVTDLQRVSQRMVQEQGVRSQETASQLVQKNEEDISSLEEDDGRDDSGIGGAGDQGAEGAPSMPVRASLEETPDGVVIVYKAVDASKQQQLSSEIHRNAEQMASGSCPTKGDKP